MGDLPLSSLIPVLAGVAFAVAGVVMIVLGIRRQIIVSALNRSGERVRGVVTDTEYTRTRDVDGASTTSTKTERIAFTTAQGEHIHRSPIYADLTTGHRTDQEVLVIHDARRPERFVAPKDGRRMGAGATMLRVGLGIGFIVIGVIAGCLFLFIAVLTS